ncbi:ribokinase [Sporosarcina sp. ACRSL]|uniref:ribokinase n=1 Tax=Sporosarcina sp. ACRSL TaxID=2918215 RepID=UPI001EF5FC5B|nr:ribokinase [Sporosarcina sp. ACRSL]MCG7344131.1 ribokinase [Sporosarcina sp. ACRSL]
MITVIGSMNMDLVVDTKRVPENGETILGKDFYTFPGGKGANQAVAAARLGGNVHMIACVGNDSFGTELIQNLNEERVDTANVSRSSDKSTGIANIILSENDNRIIVVPGANYELSPQTIEGLRDVIKASKVVVMQLEILPETVKSVLKICEELNVPVVMDPAPAEFFDKDMISGVRYMTPNHYECEQLFGVQLEEALEMYPNQLIVTLGKDGVRYFDGEKHIHVEAIPTNAVDTTGAGDTFNGALAYAISHEYALYDAVKFANTASSLSVEKLGAQTGMPTKEEVEARIARLNK